MKIKYDMSKNYFSCYNEAQGIMMSKNEILKKPTAKSYNYIEKGIVNLLLVIIALIISKFLNYFNNFDIISKIINIIAVIALCLLVLYYVLFFIGYLVEKNKIHVGNLEVDNEGIKDFSESGTIIGFSWDNIKAVVIKKHTVNVITDSSIYLFIDIKYKERLLKAIERYNPNLLIIDNTK